MKRLIFLILLFLSFITTRSQELNCTVTVSAPTLEGSDKRIFEVLQNSLADFVNSRKWTGYNFRMEEKLDCTILLMINERTGADYFKGTMNVALRRPVFGTSYNSPILNYVDKKVEFAYLLNQPLEYMENVYTSNLTSSVAFYIYFMLGIYFDSFSQNGGAPFFEKAKSVVDAAQSASESGWKAYDDTRNRYWLAENFTNPSFAGIHDFLYKYHRLGMDVMSEKLDEGRSNTTASIETLHRLYKSRPGLFAIQIMLDAKREEFINLYSSSRVGPAEKSKIVNLLKEIDPANGSNYQAIMDAK